MSVQNVVLGQLIQRRGYGYELRDRIRDWAEALDLSEAAVYAALRKLAEHGLIVEAGRDPARRGERWSNPRVIYEATPLGHERFRRWMAEPARKAPLREELHMQLIVAEERDIPALIAGLGQMEDDCRERLARILACSLDGQAPATARISAWGARFVQNALTAHLQATLEWAQDTRRALERRLAAAPAAGGRDRP